MSRTISVFDSRFSSVQPCVEIAGCTYTWTVPGRVSNPPSGIDLARDVDVEGHDRRPEISGELKIVLVEGPQPPRRHPLALGTEVNRAPGSPEETLGSLEPSGPVG